MNNLRQGKTIHRNRQSSTLRFVLSNEELTSVLIAITNADLSLKNEYLRANSKVIWKESHSVTIMLQYHPSLQEVSLRGAAVHLLWLNYHQCVIFQVVE